MRLPIKHSFFVAGVFASFSLVSVLGCSADSNPSPASAGAASGGSNAGAGTGGSTASGGGGGATGGAPAATGGSAGAATAGANNAGAANTTPGDPVQGQSAYGTQCSICHGATGQGGLGPNITASVTAGVGSWAQADFEKAVRQGVGKDGQPLCPSMTRYSASTLSDSDLKNIYAYLRTVTNDAVNAGIGCP
jgi:mono/diheme cytochrome c family protein